MIKVRKITPVLESEQFTKDKVSLFQGRVTIVHLCNRYFALKGVSFGNPTVLAVYENDWIVETETDLRRFEPDRFPSIYETVGGKNERK